VDYYSPITIVRARLFQENKEAEAAKEEAAKMQRRVVREANKLRKAEEQEEKDREAAEQQL
jgi:hypothetical protein